MSYTPKETIVVTKVNKCTGVGAQANNLFTLTGTVKVLDIYGIVITKTDSTTLTAVALAESDGVGGTAAITEMVAGTNGSGVDVGSTFIRNAAAATGITINVSGSVLVTDRLDAIDPGFYMTKVIARTTTIALGYTGDAATDVDIKWTVRYVPISDGASLV